jgi:threonylcarbamoyladenosine tRNA methylthiotransferase MtaB
MRVFLDAIGCRLNQSEIESLARQLRLAGHDIVDDVAQADKVVLNTCAVTAEATADARSRARRFQRQNAGADILLTGCYATIAPAEVAALPGVRQVVTNPDKQHLLRILDPHSDERQPIYEQEPIMRELLLRRLTNARAFVKVQDGCDNKCTFCITTVARGEGRSRRLGDIVAEVQALAAAGYQEVVLTGVHLGSYGHDLGNRSGLRELAAALLRHTDIPRLRLSSLEPWDIDAQFFSLWEDQRLLPHLHLPLQSGSDRILRLMARKTRRDSFRELAQAARAQIPHLHLSTDLIAGFPGELDDDHRQTVDFAQEIGFGRLHVFTYSRRPGTAAATMPGQLPKHTRKQRAAELIALGESLGLSFHTRQVGRVRPVLWETALGADENGLRWTGYTDNFIRVSAYGPASLFNQITPAILSEARPDGMSAELVDTVAGEFGTKLSGHV